MKPKPTSKPPTSKPPTSKPPTSKPPTYKPPTYKPPTFKPIENGCLFDRTDCLFEWIMLGVGIFIIFIPLLRYIFINRFEHLSV